MTLDTLTRCEDDRLGNEACKNYMIGNTKKDQTDWVIVGLAVIFGMALDRAALSF